MGRVISIHHGKDGRGRSATIKTGTGELTRPFQRLHRLEVHHQPVEQDPVEVGEEAGTLEEVDHDVEDETPVVTRSGRQVVRPQRLNL